MDCFTVKAMNGLKLKESTAWVGISDHAQHALGSVVFIELPKVRTNIQKKEML